MLFVNEPINRLKKQTFATLNALEDHFKALEHPLKKMALNTVFSTHNAHANIMVIGEAPGADEDEQGLPFVGRSGQLLTLMIESIGFTRDDVYITNLVPWRPPGNRNPSKEEMDFFVPYLKQHIKLKNPSCIVLLGSIVARALLGDDIRISQVRGSWQNFAIESREFPLLCTFHPSYLLRSPRQKKLAWFDFLLIKDFCAKSLAKIA